MRESPLLLPVPRPNAPVQDLARWFTRASFGVEVAHNGVKMGFAISDEVIYVLISHNCLLLQQYGQLLGDKPELYLDDIFY